LIDVIIPVYKGLAQTRRCVESVLANRQLVPFATVIVDDASPEPQIGAYLDQLAREGRIELVRNETNEGFVRSANRGMRLHADRDVVLLNSDTEVANDWLDRLSASAYANERIATATPFSNNATICSYPYEGWTGAMPGTLSLGELDRMFAQTNARESVDIPTAVGFCMFVRRQCLDAIGLFDAERFGRGYGEENDFCMRAGKAGWRHVLAADVFVFHEGGVSFSDERFTLVRENARVLVEAHPEYNRVVHEFILADPARKFRDAVDAARMKHGHEEGAALLRERSDERARLLRGLLQLDKVAAESQSKIGQLSYALEHAGTQLAERDRAIADLTTTLLERTDELVQAQQEMERLRAGLKHAETLAFSRMEELDRIKSFWLWRAFSAAMRRFSKGTFS
jgi:GT2 family glycosyltransferase